MKEADITQALTSAIEAAAFTQPIVWENQDAPDPLPETYLAVQHIRTLRPTSNLKGTKSRSEGYLQITVAGPKGKHVTPGEDVADLVSGAFPVGRRIASPGGIVTIRSSRVLSGFPDDVRWRVPVRIDYRAIPD